MADLKNDPSLKKVPEKFKVIMTEVAENIKQNGSFTGFVYGSQAEQYIRTWNQSDQTQLKAALNEYAAKHNGVLEGFTDLRTGNPLVDPKTGKAPTPDAFLQQLGELSVNHMATAVKTPTLKVGDQKITAIGQPATEEEKKKEEEKKGWFARNWGWFVPALAAALGGAAWLIAWLVHKNRKTNKIVPDDKKPVTPTPGGDKDPSGDKDPDNPGKDPDNPGKDPDNPGKDPDNPGGDKEPDNPGKDDPTPSNPGNWDSPSTDNGSGEGLHPAEPGLEGGGGDTPPSTGGGNENPGADTPSTGGDNDNSGGTSGDTPSTGTGGGTSELPGQNITDKDHEEPSTGGEENPGADTPSTDTPGAGTGGGQTLPGAGTEVPDENPGSDTGTGNKRPGGRNPSPDVDIWW